MARIAYCPYCEVNPEYLMVWPAIAIGDDGQMIRTETAVLLENDGSPTDIWADGTMGVPKDIQEMAEAEEEPYCAQCKGDIEWAETQEN